MTITGRLGQLRAVTGATGGGDWFLTDDLADALGQYAMTDTPQVDAEFIATFDPETVLLLLEIAETVEVHLGAGTLDSVSLAGLLDRLAEVTR